MEGHKQPKTTVRSRSKLLMLLPKVTASGVSFQNPPFSPGRSSDTGNIKRSLTHTYSSLDPNINNHRTKSHMGKGFSGPLMVSIIPAEARRRTKGDESADFDTPEPVSPKVSCIGKIKHKKKWKSEADKPKKKRPSAVSRIFGSGGRKQGRAERKSTDSSLGAAAEVSRVQDRAPALGQMRRFTSGRGDALAGFDWSEVQVAPVNSEQRNYHSDEEDLGQEENDEEYNEPVIAFSAPILLGGEVKDLKPKKEINLWKRRTMAPPRPLQLHPSIPPASD
ncbi:hypothetical protein SAY87_012596 [Trapa incisa]|uniref:Syringolide-induced protein 14-1-1 n=2 Tax=Trapa TaxID=22665 RepID=A0AAN7LH07_TRANT|nr:hypothetical protein SAY87_012596 [Trapa incisa]KAK4786537.1 hypothetical protein SAY86_010370 [Trapa natans]